jgi:hypothetical protein
MFSVKIFFFRPDIGIVIENSDFIVLSKDRDHMGRTYSTAAVK